MSSLFNKAPAYIKNRAVNSVVATKDFATPDEAAQAAWDENLPLLNLEGTSQTIVTDLTKNGTAPSDQFEEFIRPFEFNRRVIGPKPEHALAPKIYDIGDGERVDFREAGMVNYTASGATVTLDILSYSNSPTSTIRTGSTRGGVANVMRLYDVTLELSGDISALMPQFQIGWGVNLRYPEGVGADPYVGLMKVTAISGNDVTGQLWMPDGTVDVPNPLDLGLLFSHFPPNKAIFRPASIQWSGGTAAAEGALNLWNGSQFRASGFDMMQNGAGDQGCLIYVREGGRFSCDQMGLCEGEERTVRVFQGDLIISRSCIGGGDDMPTHNGVEVQNQANVTFIRSSFGGFSGSPILIGNLSTCQAGQIISSGGIEGAFKAQGDGAVVTLYPARLSGKVGVISKDGATVSMQPATVINAAVGISCELGGRTRGAVTYGADNVVETITPKGIEIEGGGHDHDKDGLKPGLRFGRVIRPAFTSNPTSEGEGLTLSTSANGVWDVVLDEPANDDQYCIDVVPIELGAGIVSLPRISAKTANGFTVEVTDTAGAPVARRFEVTVTA